ncbi:hypothetical protein [Micromonospora sp. NPDC092111]|uniref:hypothetical protein n=1 Tax=Micromonospora sp. NPDC092111 TaxID=3364289 RepID=UPI00381DD1AD
MTLIPHDSSPSPRVLVMAAGLTVDQHRNNPGQTTYAPGVCRQCTPTGCPQLAWRRTLDEYRAARPARPAGAPW